MASILAQQQTSKHFRRFLTKHGKYLFHPEKQIFSIYVRNLVAAKRYFRSVNLSDILAGPRGKKVDDRSGRVGPSPRHFGGKCRKENGARLGNGFVENFENICFHHSFSGVPEGSAVFRWCCHHHPSSKTGHRTHMPLKYLEKLVLKTQTSCFIISGFAKMV